MENQISIHASSFVSKDSVLKGTVKIGKNCTIERCVIENCVIKDNTKIQDSTLIESTIGSGCQIGPYARIRPNCKIASSVKIGNFVELKNALIGSRTKIPHLSYVGDCEIGEDVNIGCGVIFCNYDGKEKNKSYVGNRVFIGSNSNIIAPVVIENDSFISAGTTLTHDVLKKQLCIGRNKNETWTYSANPYLRNFMGELKYFGTDGIRGVIGKDFNLDFFAKVGYAIGKLSNTPKILIGMDTRPNGKQIKQKLIEGLSVTGASVIDAGVVSTGGLCYLTQKLGYDYGIMITASHNPSEYNGIKIFNKKGYKINENQEFFIENHLKMPKNIKKMQVQQISIEPYLNYLKQLTAKKIKKLTVFIDCANGSTSAYAREVLESLGAKVESINTGGEINKNASVLDKQVFKTNFENSKAEIGFCFDGDGDRAMCITRDYGILDGDKILYILAKYYKQKFVVGTIMTNYALEQTFRKMGIRLFRTKVGDRNIAKLMKKKDYSLGAEESGHVIIKNLLTTGDGLITALKLLEIYSTNLALFKQASLLKMYPTYSKKIYTTNKQVLKNAKVLEIIEKQNKLIKKHGRIIVRASGTEPLIRVNIESDNEPLATKILNTISTALTNEIEA